MKLAVYWKDHIDTEDTVFTLVGYSGRLIFYKLT